MLITNNKFFLKSFVSQGSGGTVVQWLECWTSDLEVGGLRPSLYLCVVSLDKKLNPAHLSLSTQVYKWVPVTYTCTAGGNAVMDWHPIQGGVAILSVASCYRNWVKPQQCGPPWLECDFIYLPEKLLDSKS